jgi:anti-anti-sigma factor
MFEVEHIRSIPVVRVTCEVDIATSELLGKTLSELARDPVIVVDLTDCRYIDSTCLRELLKRHKLNPMVVALPTTGMVKRIIDIAGLADVFPIAETEAAALTVAEGIISSGDGVWAPDASA